MRRPRAKTFRLAAVIAASAAVTAACGISNAATTTTGGLAAGPSGPPITVGISLPLSGPAQAQGFEADGQACEKGYELWASDVNSHGGLLGRPVKLIILNDKGWPASTQWDYHWFITKRHVDLTLAPFSSLLTALAAGPETEKYGYALAAGSAGAPSVYALKDHTLFSTTVPVATEMVPFANWIVSQHNHPTTAAYPMVNDPFADPPVQQAEKILSAGGIRTVYVAPTVKGVVGYTNTSPRALTADARKVVASHAGIVVIGSVDVPTVSAFIKDFIAQGYNPKILIAAAGPDQGQAFLDAVGTGNANGIMVPNGWYGAFPNALSHIMVQDYIAKYGGTVAEINADVAESYSAGETEAAAVQATHSIDQAKLIAWLHSHTIQTVVGPVTFNGYGENVNKAAASEIFQWQVNSQAAHFDQVLPGPPHLGAVRIARTKPNWSG
jgi:branched-chain amino acid transport system substrate-binding protein